MDVDVTPSSKKPNKVEPKKKGKNGSTPASRKKKESEDEETLYAEDLQDESEELESEVEEFDDDNEDQVRGNGH